MLLIFFIFGLLFGSFLNVVALRLPKGEKFWQGRSHCVFCQKILRWFELIPILSFLWQGGKCRNCRRNLSLRYLLVELITGFLFAGVYYFLPGIDGLYFWHTLFFYLIIISVLEIIFLIDWSEGVILDILVWPFAILSLFFWFITGANWLNYLLSGLGCVIFFGAQFLFSRGRWLGAGDIGLGFLLGIFLGWPKILSALFFSYLGGALIGIILLLLKKKKWASSLPFAVFLVPGAILALFWGDFFVNWYLGILGKF